MKSASEARSLALYLCRYAARHGNGQAREMPTKTGGHADMYADVGHTDRIVRKGKCPEVGLQ